METLFHADVFFFVTTVAVILVAVSLSVVLVYAIKIFRNAERVSRRIREEADEILTDVRDLRLKAKSTGFSLFKNLLRRAVSFGEKKTGRRRTKTSKK